MRIKKKEFKQWIAALRSGLYSQTRDDLQNKAGFCCLGVACIEIIHEDKLETCNIDFTDYLIGSTPSDQKNAPEWLKEINNDFHQKTSTNYITSLNDDDKMTFDEIADVLELVYIHKILD